MHLQDDKMVMEATMILSGLNNLFFSEKQTEYQDPINRLLSNGLKSPV